MGTSVVKEHAGVTCVTIIGGNFGNFGEFGGEFGDGELWYEVVYGATARTDSHESLALAGTAYL
jgi:hypothetical protein